MKYLFIILAIVCGTTALSFFLLIPPAKIPPGDIAITVNNHDIAENGVLQEITSSGYHTEEESDRYDTIITRVLLLQEAQKQKIDKEESFRKELETYYENSLIKILLERKDSQITVDVSEADINGYLSFVNTVVSFTRLDTVPNSDSEAMSARGVTKTLPFDDLATPVQLLLSSLKPGQYGVKFDTGSEKYAVRLDSVSAIDDSSPQTIDRQYILKILEDYKREQKINSWLTKLKQDAKITIHNKKQVR
jgi:hypothetical protein